MKRIKEFEINGRKYVSEFEKEIGQCSLWKAIVDNKERKFLTITKVPADQIVKFVRFGREFVFFTYIVDYEDRLGIVETDQGLQSHYDWSGVIYTYKCNLIAYKIKRSPKGMALTEFARVKRKVDGNFEFFLGEKTYWDNELPEEESSFIFKKPEKVS